MRLKVYCTMQAYYEGSTFFLQASQQPDWEGVCWRHQVLSHQDLSGLPRVRLNPEQDPLPGDPPLRDSAYLPNLFPWSTALVSFQSLGMRPRLSYMYLQLYNHIGEWGKYSWPASDCGSFWLQADWKWDRTVWPLAEWRSTQWLHNGVSPVIYNVHAFTIMWST